MKIRKSMTAIGAALMVVGMSGPASAFECGDPQSPDPALISTNLVALATELRCSPGTEANPGAWTGAPIWQKRGEGDCEVQESLAKKLNEERDFEEGDKPPRNKNNTNTAAGAANDVANGKYLSAVDKLDAFVRDAYKSRINYDFGEESGAAKMYFLGEVETARGCVCKLTECE